MKEPSTQKHGKPGLGDVEDQRPPIIDLHEDIAFYVQSLGAGQPFGPYREDLPSRQADAPKYRRGNVRIVFSALFPAVEVYGLKPHRGEYEAYPSFASSRLLLLDQVKTIYRVASEIGAVIAERESDAEGVLHSPTWRLGFVIHLEGADPLADPLDLELLYKLGLRSLGLTWNWDNQYAASCMTRRDYGLTARGEELVREANRLGIIIDVAHASDRAALEAIEVSRRPVMLSHGNLRSWVDTPRNTADEILEALATNRGVFGISLITSNITRERRATINDVARQIIDIVERYGHQLPAIGSDYHGLVGIQPPEGLESVDKLQKLLNILREAGLSENAIKSIAYGNAYRVIVENLR